MTGLAGLEAAFEAHKVPVLAAAGAGVAGLALLRKRKSAAGSGATGAAGAAPAGPVPFSAGGQAAGATGAASYDSTASDLYGAIQPQLEALQTAITQQSATPPTPVPARPVASTLFGPTGSGRYVQNQNGTIAEVESDGSLYGLQLGEWLPYYKQGARPGANIANTVPMYSIGANLADRAAALTPKSSTAPAA